MVLTKHRKGTTIESAVKSISMDMLNIFNYALVWGTSTKHSPQRCGLQHVLADGDVLQVVTKTVKQQKQSKDYQKSVQDYYDAYHAKKNKVCDLRL